MHSFARRASATRGFVAKLALAFLLMAGSCSAMAATCYVDGAASGTNDGSSWANAYTGLQDALGDPGCSTIWIAEGLYKPSTSAFDESVSFVIPGGTEVYGGFVAGQTALSQRDIAAHPTVLSGDIGNDDLTDANGVVHSPFVVRGSNSNHVVVLDGTTTPVTSSTVLDGLTVTAGEADSMQGPGTRGGGLFCNAGSGECSPTLRHMVFAGNSADRSGGAMYVTVGAGGSSALILNDVRFEGNVAQNRGGAFNLSVDGGNAEILFSQVAVNENSSNGGAGVALHVEGGTLAFTLQDSTFSGNQANVAGALALTANASGHGTLTVTNATFSNNSAQVFGGAVLLLAQPSATIQGTITHATFTGNQAAGAGAIMVQDSIAGLASTDSPAGAPQRTSSTADAIDLALDSVIFWGNLAPAGGRAIAVTGHSVSLDYSIVQGGDAATYDMMAGTPLAIFSAGTGNIDADPKLGSLGDHGGSTQTRLPGRDGAAIDVAPCSFAPATAKDQRGISRPQGAGCDIGAVELQQSKLDVDITGQGSVSATASPPPFSGGIAGCTEAGGTSCGAWYAPGDVVTLLAAPVTGWHVSSWSGACTGTGQVATRTMTTSGTCSVVFARGSHSVGGSITGLAAGQQITLALDDDGAAPALESITRTADGNFTFATSLAYGSSYTVSVASQPADQTCSVSNASGTIGLVDVTNVAVSCATNRYTIGGTLSGLGSGKSAILLLNGGSALTVSADGSFSFPVQLASGQGYAVSVGTQPSGQVCTVANGSGTVAAADVTNVAVSCTTAVVNLAVSVDDGHAYNRYGLVRDYVVTITNNGNVTASNLAVSTSFSTAFDASYASWFCTTHGGGTVCNNIGASGPLTDTATVPAGASVTWRVTVPVRADSPDATATLTALAGSVSGADTDTLVIFRDGLDVAYADGTMAKPGDGFDSTSVLYGSDSLVLPATPPRPGITTVRSLRAGAMRVDVERLVLARGQYVRLRLHPAKGGEHATRWTPFQPGQPLAIGSVAGQHGQRLLLLEGAARPLALPLPPSSIQAPTP